MVFLTILLYLFLLLVYLPGTFFKIMDAFDDFGHKSKSRRWLQNFEWEDSRIRRLEREIAMGNYSDNYFGELIENLDEAKADALECMKKYRYHKFRSSMRYIVFWPIFDGIRLAKQSSIERTREQKALDTYNKFYLGK